MAQYEYQQIYLDLCKLLKEVTKAGYEESMTARDKVDCLVPIKNDIKECMRCFLRAFREKDKMKSLQLVEALAVEFGIALMDIHLADDEHIWRGKKDEHGNVRCAKRIEDLIPRIDNGIEKWAASMKKGRPASEAGCGSII